MVFCEYIARQAQQAHTTSYTHTTRETLTENARVDAIATAADARCVCVCIACAYTST